jgi:hypothetical protein
MPLTPRAILSTQNVRTKLQQAWTDSNPGVNGGHEEGGFIVKDGDDKLSVVRWPKGSKDSIQVPSHAGCKIDGLEIIASFHTHPNTGSDYTWHGHKLWFCLAHFSHRVHREKCVLRVFSQRSLCALWLTKSAICSRV